MKETLDEILGLTPSLKLSKDRIRNIINGYCPFEGVLIENKHLTEICHRKPSLCPLKKECIDDKRTKEYDPLVELGKELWRKRYGKESP